MEENQGISSESSASTEEVSTAPEESGATEQTTQVEQGEAQAYMPSYKFKVKDKELEFDDFVRSAVKDKDTEAKLRDLYERAYGLEEVKNSRNTFEQKYKELDGKYSQVSQSLKQLGGFLQENRMGDFFQALNIPKDKIIEYAIEELKYQELPPEQKQAIEYQRQLQAEYEMANQQNQTLQQQMQELVQAQVRQELTFELNKPEVVKVMQAFDARIGKLGAFESEVIRRGQYYEQFHQTSPPASQLVQEVLAFVGQSQAEQIATPEAVAAAQAQKPVIPTFKGGSQKSPTQKVPNSIDDLRKLRQMRQG